VTRGPKCDLDVAIFRLFAIKLGPRNADGTCSVAARENTAEYGMHTLWDTANNPHFVLTLN
jgi:hypothetical protein